MLEAWGTILAKLGERAGNTPRFDSRGQVTVSASYEGHRRYRAPRAAASWSRFWVRVRVQSLLTWSSGLYFVCVLGLWLFQRVAPENSWLLHMFLFGPRWTVGFPLLLLLPLAAAYRTRLLCPLLIAFVIVMLPISGFVIPSGFLWSRPTGGLRLRILCCNTDNTRLDTGRLDALIDECQPDLVVLQEWAHRARPPSVTRNGWTVLDEGGELFVASRYPIRKARQFPGNRGNGAHAIQYELRTGKLSVDSDRPSPPESEGWSFGNARKSARSPGSWGGNSGTPESSRSAGPRFAGSLPVDWPAAPARAGSRRFQPDGREPDLLAELVPVYRCLLGRRLWAGPHLHRKPSVQRPHRSCSGGTRLATTSLPCRTRRGCGTPTVDRGSCLGRPDPHREGDSIAACVNGIGTDIDTHDQ